MAHQRRLAEPQKDGHAERVHLQRAADMGSAEAKAELAGPELPEACAHVWTWFLELNSTRGFNGVGPSALSYPDIDAWARLTGRAPLPHEVAWLRLVDQAWLTPPKDDR